jgi:hypothetical protein
VVDLISARGKSTTDQMPNTEEQLNLMENKILGLKRQIQNLNRRLEPDPNNSMKYEHNNPMKKNDTAQA